MSSANKCSSPSLWIRNAGTYTIKNILWSLSDDLRRGHLINLTFLGHIHTISDQIKKGRRKSSILHILNETDNLCWKIKQRKMRKILILLTTILCVTFVLLGCIPRVESICCVPKNRIGCGGKGRCNLFCCSCSGGCDLSTMAKHPDSPYLKSAGRILASNSYLLSPNEKYSAEMQHDGNFVIYVYIYFLVLVFGMNLS